MGEFKVLIDRKVTQQVGDIALGWLQQGRRTLMDLPLQWLH